jgi:hypothetical protein
MAPTVAHRHAVGCALVAALLGGVVGWSAAFIGLGLWGLVIGLAASVVSFLVLASRVRAREPLAATAAYGVAFILLTWPLPWLVVGYVRYAITGQSLGD